MPQPRGWAPPGTRTSFCCGGPSLEELSGGNWMAAVDGRLFAEAASVTGRACLFIGAVPAWL